MYTIIFHFFISVYHFALIFISITFCTYSVDNFERTLSSSFFKYIVIVFHFIFSNVSFVSNFVLSFQFYLFPIFLRPFYLILTAFPFQFSVPLLSCHPLQLIYSFMISKEINVKGSTELFIF